MQVAVKSFSLDIFVKISDSLPLVFLPIPTTTLVSAFPLITTYHMLTDDTCSHHICTLTKGQLRRALTAAMCPSDEEFLALILLKELQEA